jgi:hypothetical protein
MMDRGIERFSPGAFSDINWRKLDIKRALEALGSEKCGKKY